MNRGIPEIYDLLQNLSWYFGNQGFDGECCEDLSLVEYMVLKKAFDRQNINMHELGISLNITKSGISKIIDRLENRLYLARHQSSADGRVCCILLTDKGNSAIRKISKHYSEYLHEILGAEDDKALLNIKATLTLIFEAIQDKGFIKSN